MQEKQEGKEEIFIWVILGCVLGMCVVFCRIFFIYLLMQNKEPKGRQQLEKS